MDMKKIRKIQINEFVSEMSSDQYFRNIPDFSKFTKPGTLETDNPLLDCDIISGPLMNKKTNISILNKEIISPEPGMNLEYKDNPDLLPVSIPTQTIKSNIKLNRSPERTDPGPNPRELNLRSRKVQFQT